MKTTKAFKEAILKDLNERASEDPFFEVRFQNEEKNIDDCITYILNQVQKSGCNGFEDSEIFNMAYHYYDEDNIEIGGAFNGSVVVNHTVVLTEEEKAEAKQKAIDSLIQQERNKMLKKPEAPKTSTLSSDNEPTLF
mgnify:CR=1 FL=1|jgi:hypothetical protein